MPRRGTRTPGRLGRREVAASSSPCWNPQRRWNGARAGFDRDGVSRIPERRDLGGRRDDRRDLLQSRDRGMRPARQRQQPGRRRTPDRVGPALPVTFRGLPAMRGWARPTAT